MSCVCLSISNTGDGDENAYFVKFNHYHNQFVKNMF